MDGIENEQRNDADGFECYRSNTGNGLVNQGWKDSNDSIFHADGTLAQGAIAVVEVQGYAYAAFRTMAALSDRRRDPDAGSRWRKRAEALRNAVEQKFWIEDMGFYALARDGDGKPCRVRGSNPGHLLFTGLASRKRARRVAEQLLSPALNSGWGIRTLAHGEARYNPMSYHNGSVWPHDGAICTSGIARYGDRDGVVKM